MNKLIPLLIALLSTLTVSAKIGDTNRDGIVDVTDLNVMINSLINNDQYSTVDVDFDGHVDVADLNLIINIIVGKYDEANIITTVARAWNALTYPDAGFAAFTEMATDNIVDNSSPSTKSVGIWEQFTDTWHYDCDSVRFAFGDYFGNENDTPTKYWNACYQAIANSNHVLKAVARFEQQSGLSSDERAQLPLLRGEALLIRAYYHWQLANIFCMPYAGERQSNSLLGVPYLTTDDETDIYQPNRDNLQQTYQNIEADLVTGLSLVGNHWNENANAHFNPNAANAFAARFYLYKRDYNRVVQYASAAFGDKLPAEWMADDIWNNNYVSDLIYHTDSRSGVWLKNKVYSTWLRHFVSATRYRCNREAMRATIEGEGPTWWDIRWRNSFGEIFSMHPAFPGYLYFSGALSYGKFFKANITEHFEYTDTVLGIGYAFQIPAEFTANETLLCRAEANLFLGNIDAAVEDLKTWDENLRIGVDAPMHEFTSALVNDFYSKRLERFEANVNRAEELGEKYLDSCYFGIARPIRVDKVCPAEKTLSSEIMPYLQCVQHFRRLETIHTGLRFFDLKRLGISVTHVIGSDGRHDTLDLNDPRWAIQIPTRAIAAGMTPNPR